MTLDPFTIPIVRGDRDINVEVDPCDITVGYSADGMFHLTEAEQSEVREALIDRNDMRIVLEARERFNEAFNWPATA